MINRRQARYPLTSRLDSHIRESSRAELMASLFA
jgi:hypothetical protein